MARCVFRAEKPLLRNVRDVSAEHLANVAPLDRGGSLSSVARENLVQPRRLVRPLHQGRFAALAPTPNGRPLDRREGASFDAVVDCSCGLAPSPGTATTNSGRLRPHEKRNESKLAMARPRKHEAERRSSAVRADLTLAEKCYVQQQAASAGLSEAEYLRRRALGFAVPFRSEKESKAALVSEINRLGGQLAALGNLANQIALACHTGRTLPPAWEVLPSEIKELSRRVENALEQVMMHDGP